MCKFHLALFFVFCILTQGVFGWIRFRYPYSRRVFLEQTALERLQNCAGLPEEQCGLCGEGPTELQTTTIPERNYLRLDLLATSVQIEVAFREDLGGQFEFRVCEMGSNMIESARKCREVAPLLIGGDRNYSPIQRQTSARLPLDFPPGVRCEHCVLQVKYTPDRTPASLENFTYYDCAPVNLTVPGVLAGASPSGQSMTVSRTVTINSSTRRGNEQPRVVSLLTNQRTDSQPTARLVINGGTTQVGGRLSSGMLSTGSSSQNAASFSGVRDNTAQINLAGSSSRLGELGNGVSRNNINASNFTRVSVENMSGQNAENMNNILRTVNTMNMRSNTIRTSGTNTGQATFNDNSLTGNIDGTAVTDNNIGFDQTVANGNQMLGRFDRISNSNNAIVGGVDNSFINGNLVSGAVVNGNTVSQAADRTVVNGNSVSGSLDTMGANDNSFSGILDVTLVNGNIVSGRLDRTAENGNSIAGNLNNPVVNSNTISGVSGVNVINSNNILNGGFDRTISNSLGSTVVNSNTVSNGMGSTLVNGNSIASNLDRTSLTGNSGSGSLDTPAAESTSFSGILDVTLVNGTIVAADLERTAENGNTISGSLNNPVVNSNIVSGASDITIVNSNNMLNGFDRTVSNVRTVSDGSDSSFVSSNTVSNGMGSTLINGNNIASNLDRTVVNGNSASGNLDTMAANGNSFSGILDVTLVNGNIVAGSLDTTAENSNTIAGNVNSPVVNSNMITGSLGSTVFNDNTAVNGAFETAVSNNLASTPGNGNTIIPTDPNVPQVNTVSISGGADQQSANGNILLLQIDRTAGSGQGMSGAANNIIDQSAALNTANSAVEAAIVNTVASEVVLEGSSVSEAITDTQEAIGNAVSNTQEAIGNAVSNTQEAIADTQEAVGNAVSNAVEAATDTVGESNLALLSASVASGSLSGTPAVGNNGLGGTGGVAAGGNTVSGGMAGTVENSLVSSGSMTTGFVTSNNISGSVDNTMVNNNDVFGGLGSTLINTNTNSGGFGSSIAGVNTASNGIGTTLVSGGTVTGGLMNTNTVSGSLNRPIVTDNTVTRDTGKTITLDNTVSGNFDSPFVNGNIGLVSGRLDATANIGNSISGDVNRVNNGNVRSEILETTFVNRDVFSGNLDGRVNGGNAGFDRTGINGNSISGNLDTTIVNRNVFTGVSDGRLGNGNAVTGRFDRTVVSGNTISNGNRVIVNDNIIPDNWNRNVINSNTISNGIDRTVVNGNTVTTGGLGPTVVNSNTITNGLGRTVMYDTSVTGGLESTVNGNTVSNGLDRTLTINKTVTSGLDSAVVNDNAISSGLDRTIVYDTSVTGTLDSAVVNGNTNTVSNGLDRTNIINRTVINSLDSTIVNGNMGSSGLDRSVVYDSTLSGGFDSATVNTVSTGVDRNLVIDNTASSRFDGLPVNNNGGSVDVGRISVSETTMSGRVDGTNVDDILPRSSAVTGGLGRTSVNDKDMIGGFGQTVVGQNTLSGERRDIVIDNTLSGIEGTYVGDRTDFRGLDRTYITDRNIPGGFGRSGVSTRYDGFDRTSVAGDTFSGGFNKQSVIDTAVSGGFDRTSVVDNTVSDRFDRTSVVDNTVSDRFDRTSVVDSTMSSGFDRTNTGSSSPVVDNTISVGVDRTSVVDNTMLNGLNRVSSVVDNTISTGVDRTSIVDNIVTGGLDRTSLVDNTVSGTFDRSPVVDNTEISSLDRTSVVDTSVPNEFDRAFVRDNTVSGQVDRTSLVDTSVPNEFDRAFVRDNTVSSQVDRTSVVDTSVPNEFDRAFVRDNTVSGQVDRTSLVDTSVPNEFDRAFVRDNTVSSQVDRTSVVYTSVPNEFDRAFVRDNTVSSQVDRTSVVDTSVPNELDRAFVRDNTVSGQVDRTAVVDTSVPNEFDRAFVRDNTVSSQVDRTSVVDTSVPNEFDRAFVRDNTVSSQVDRTSVVDTSVPNEFDRAFVRDNTVSGQVDRTSVVDTSVPNELDRAFVRDNTVSGQVDRTSVVDTSVPYELDRAFVRDNTVSSQVDRTSVIDTSVPNAFDRAFVRDNTVSSQVDRTSVVDTSVPNELDRAFVRDNTVSSQVDRTSVVDNTVSSRFDRAPVVDNTVSSGLDRVSIVDNIVSNGFERTSAPDNMHSEGLMRQAVVDITMSGGFDRTSVVDNTVSNGINRISLNDNTGLGGSVNLDRTSFSDMRSANDRVPILGGVGVTPMTDNTVSVDIGRSSTINNPIAGGLDRTIVTDHSTFVDYDRTSVIGEISGSSGGTIVSDRNRPTNITFISTATVSGSQTGQSGIVGNDVVGNLDRTRNSELIAGGSVDNSPIVDTSLNKDIYSNNANVQQNVSLTLLRTNDTVSTSVNTMETFRNGSSDLGGIVLPVGNTIVNDRSLDMTYAVDSGKDSNNVVVQNTVGRTDWNTNTWREATPSNTVGINSVSETLNDTQSMYDIPPIDTLTDRTNDRLSLKQEIVSVPNTITVFPLTFITPNPISLDATRYVDKTFETRPILPSVPSVVYDSLVPDTATMRTTGARQPNIVYDIGSHASDVSLTGRDTSLSTTGDSVPVETPIKIDLSPYEATTSYDFQYPETTTRRYDSRSSSNIEVSVIKTQNGNSNQQRVVESSYDVSGVDNTVISQPNAGSASSNNGFIYEHADTANNYTLMAVNYTKQDVRASLTDNTISAVQTAQNNIDNVPNIPVDTILAVPAETTTYYPSETRFIYNDVTTPIPETLSVSLDKMSTISKEIHNMVVKKTTAATQETTTYSPRFDIGINDVTTPHTPDISYGFGDRVNTGINVDTSVMVNGNMVSQENTNYAIDSTNQRASGILETTQSNVLPTTPESPRVVFNDVVTNLPEIQVPIYKPMTTDIPVPIQPTERSRVPMPQPKDVVEMVTITNPGAVYISRKPVAAVNISKSMEDKTGDVHFIDLENNVDRYGGVPITGTNGNSGAFFIASKSGSKSISSESRNSGFDVTNSLSKNIVSGIGGIHTTSAEKPNAGFVVFNFSGSDMVLSNIARKDDKILADVVGHSDSNLDNIRLRPDSSSNVLGTIKETLSSSPVDISMNVGSSAVVSNDISNNRLDVQTSNKIVTLVDESSRLKPIVPSTTSSNELSGLNVDSISSVATNTVWRGQGVMGKSTINGVSKQERTTNNIADPITYHFFSLVNGKPPRQVNNLSQVSGKSATTKKITVTSSGTRSDTNSGRSTVNNIQKSTRTFNSTTVSGDSSRTNKTSSTIWDLNRMNNDLTDVAKEVSVDYIANPTFPTVVTGSFTDTASQSRTDIDNFFIDQQAPDKMPPIVVRYANEENTYVVQNPANSRQPEPVYSRPAEPVNSRPTETVVSQQVTSSTGNTGDINIKILRTLEELVTELKIRNDSPTDTAYDTVFRIYNDTNIDANRYDTNVNAVRSSADTNVNIVRSAADSQQNSQFKIVPNTNLFYSTDSINTAVPPPIKPGFTEPGASGFNEVGMVQLGNLKGVTDERKWNVNERVQVNKGVTGERKWNVNERVQVNAADRKVPESSIYQNVIRIPTKNAKNGRIFEILTGSFANTSAIKRTKLVEDITSAPAVPKKFIVAESQTVQTDRNFPEITQNPTIIEGVARPQVVIHPTQRQIRNPFAGTNINLDNRIVDKIGHRVAVPAEFREAPQSVRASTLITSQTGQQNTQTITNQNPISIEGKYYVGEMRRNEFGQFEPVPIGSDILLQDNTLLSNKPQANTGVFTDPTRHFGSTNTLTDTNSFGSTNFLTDTNSLDAQRIENMNNNMFVSQEALLNMIKAQRDMAILPANMDPVREPAVRVDIAEPTNMPIISPSVNRESTGFIKTSTNLQKSLSPTTQPKTLICEVGSQFSCEAVGSYRDIPGMVWWCFSHCKNGVCPREKCDCSCSIGKTKDRTTVVVTESRPRVKKVINLTLNGAEASVVPVGDTFTGLSSQKEYNANVPASPVRRTVVSKAQVQNSVNNLDQSNAVCRGINAFASTRGMDDWCTTMCRRNVCPPEICACS